MRRFAHSAVVIPLLFAAGLAACSPDSPVTLPDPACPTGVVTDLTTLGAGEGTIVRGPGLQCIRLRADAEYVVMPQLLGEVLPYVYQPFLIGDPDAAVQTAPILSQRPSPRELPAHERLHSLLRARERDLAATSARSVRTPTRIPAVAHAAAVDPQPRRELSVLASLDDPPRFARVAAALRYTGDEVLLYVDERSAAAYTDQELAALGNLFDDLLFPIDRASFGEGSDIDGNGRIIVLITPTVNALVSAQECASRGFATGFFYGFDLASLAAESNRGEIFYAMAPDPDGIYSCAHTKQEAAAILPPTFLHEVQHMISYGHRVVARGKTAEVPWLNEGLSHIAEELGSLAFETRYPPPAGRTRPTQIFPDSATSYIVGDLFNSYRFLSASEQYSVVSCAPGSFCSTPERGGAWLFLRWLAGATRDPDLFAKLVRSDLQGVRNVETVAGRPFGDLFGDFVIATWADSIVGSPRVASSDRFRFATRNLRALYSALFEAYGPLGGVPRPFPMVPVELTAGQRLKSAMRPGTFQAFRLAAATNRGEVAVAFTRDDGAPFDAGHAAQLSVYRVRPQ